MHCPKCKSTNISFQVINETTLVKKHHGFLWWIFIGWWWVAIKWLVFTVPAIIIKIFAPNKYKTKNAQVSMAVCQECGHMWEVKRTKAK